MSYWKQTIIAILFAESGVAICSIHSFWLMLLTVFLIQIPAWLLWDRWGGNNG